MSGIALFAFGFAAGALTFAAATFIASLPRLEDWDTYQDCGAEASIPPQPGCLSAAGPTGGFAVQSEPASFIPHDGELGGSAVVPVVGSHRDRPVLYRVK